MKKDFPVDMPQEMKDIPVDTPQEDAWAATNQKFCKARWI
jgi:hypothetical protein